MMMVMMAGAGIALGRSLRRGKGPQFQGGKGLQCQDGKGLNVRGQKHPRSLRMGCLLALRPDHGRKRVVHTRTVVELRTRLLHKFV